jgi:hypothetical protein
MVEGNNSPLQSVQKDKETIESIESKKLSLAKEVEKLLDAAKNDIENVDMLVTSIDGNQSLKFPNLKQQVSVVAKSILPLFKSHIDQEREKMLKYLHQSEVESNILLRNLKMSESKCALLDSFLSEAKQKNSDYGQSASEGIQRNINYILVLKVY